MPGNNEGGTSGTDHGEHSAGGSSRVQAFRNRLGFELDAFQVEACSALDAGRGVLVAAPTGAGKTVVGEFAAYLALAEGTRTFYTTPIKALSNQKFAELSAAYGSARTGLLTGDTSINPEADVVVMTTEVLRSMLYSGSPALDCLKYVVMDEVHYLADRTRGAVWEEVIIQLPAAVTLVSLSATISNAEEFGAWLQAVRGNTAVVVSEHRPVPLFQHVMAGNQLFDLFAARVAFDGLDPQSPTLLDEQPLNPNLLALSDAASLVRPDVAYDQERGRTRQFDRSQNPDGRRLSKPWARVLQRLNGDRLLPAITFIFSRAGCDAAVESCIGSGLWLTDLRERTEILRQLDNADLGLAGEDLEPFGFAVWRDGLRRGIAAHHAGMLPAFRQLVEKLFAQGLLKAVFATETLSLGINMPARAVVLERLEKFNGEAVVPLTAGEYTQLTGRAGRRGIDTEGHAVVLWRPGMDPAALAGLASRRTYPLNSRFLLTYNMAANLVARLGRDGARGLLERSFARFQAPRSGDSVDAFLSGTLDGLLRVLAHYGYLAEDAQGLLIDDGGARLRSIYGERDLLTCLSLDRGALGHLEAEELAGFAATVVYRSGRSAAGPRKMPTAGLQSSFRTLMDSWAELSVLEQRYGVPGTPEPETGLVRPLFGWASGENLADVLPDTGLSAGGFVYWARRCADLLRQVAAAQPLPAATASMCREAVALIQRGAVARGDLVD